MITIKSTRFIFYLLFVLIATGCNNAPVQNQTVLLEPTRTEKLILGSSSRIIKLETSAESNLGYISKTEYDITNNRIFVMSEFNLYFFNQEGKFITKLKKGKGPGEISMITALSVNRKNKLLYALDNANLIHIYDYDGNFISESHLKDIYAIDIHALDVDNVLLQNLRVSESMPWFVVKYTLNENKISSCYIPSEKSLYPDFFMITGNSFQDSDSEITFSCTNIFSLFEWKEDSLVEIVNYDLKDKSVPESFVSETMRNKRRVRFGNDAREKGYVPYLFASFYFNNHVLAILDDEQKSCYAISRNNRNLVYLNGSVSSYLGLPDVESFCDPKEADEDYLVFAGTPTDFFDEEPLADSAIIEIGEQKLNIGLEENPFLV